MRTETACPIAIVGIAAELPSGEFAANNLDYNAFFQFLLQRGESYEFIPKDRFDIDSWRGKQLGRIIAERGSFLKNLDSFDYLEFGITSKDARAMAVSTRKLIELSFLALLDSGIEYRGRNVGCYASGNAFDILSVGTADEFEARGSFAGIPAQIANRISYHLDLLGPSVPTDTACSSSLTAMHLAIQALRTDDCEAAVVGGAQINQRLWDFVQYTQGGVLAPDGKCKPFDMGADGFSRGEGAVVMVIKPLEAALRDGDNIYGTILGTGINSAGSEAPVNAPAASAQEDTMRRAFKQANRKVEDLDYVELHATGTAKGDPTEANWVGAAFRREDELLVGSVKGNIGHLEITAFLASVCKVCGIFNSGIIPPNVSLTRLNPAIKWDEYRMRVPLEPTPLSCRSSSGKSLVSINSFGIGGSNGHCVMESPPASLPKPVSLAEGAPVLLLAGGLSPRATTAVSDSLSELVRERISQIPNISTLYGRRSRQMTWRSFAVVSPSDMTKIRFSQPTLTPRARPAVGFVFSGQGPQHMHMGRQLYKEFPAFRESVTTLDGVYSQVVGHSLVEKVGMFKDIGAASSSMPDVWPIDIILPAIAMVQIALFDLLASVGVRPDFVLGHSAGETTMLYASGAAPRAMALELAIARGQVLALTESAGGTMTALSCGPEVAKPLLDEVKATRDAGILEIACHNSAEAITIAGHDYLVDAAVELCKSKGIAATRLRTSVAVHSSMMELCKDEYYERVLQVFAKYPEARLTPNVDTFSTVTGERLAEPFSPDYYWKNTREPVLFMETVRSAQAAISGRNLLVVEVSPHPVLSAYLSALCPESATIVGPMRRTKQMFPHFERSTFLQAVGKLIAGGYNSTDFPALNGGASQHVEFGVPAYPFAPKSVPHMAKLPENDEIYGSRLGPLNHSRLRLNAATHPDLAQHVMKGEPIVPATGFVEMALEFGARSLWDVKFLSFLSLSAEEPVRVRFEPDGFKWSIKTTSYSSHGSGAASKKAERLHAGGYFSTEPTAANPPSPRLDEIRERCHWINVSGFYDDLRYFAEYGPWFQMITSVHRGEEEFLVEVDTRRQGVNVPTSHYVFDPAILDACIHVMVHPMITGNTDRNVYYLPSRFDFFSTYDALHRREFTDKLYAHGSRGRWTPEGITFDVLVVNSQGTPLCSFRGFEVAYHGLAPSVGTRYDLEYTTVASLDLNARVQKADSFSCDEITKVTDRTLYFRYIRGKEDLLRSELEKVDLTGLSIWLLALSGVDGDAALGFSRSLRRELLANEVRLVIFEARISFPAQVEVISGLLQENVAEDEITVDSTGRVLVPRLQASSPPVESTSLNPDAPWSVKRTGSGDSKAVIVQTSPPIPEQHEVLVKVDYVDTLQQSGIWAFVGRTDSGTAVAGLASDHLASHVVVHRAVVTELSNIGFDTAARLPGYIAALSIGFLALGFKAEVPSLLAQNTALVTHADTLLGTLLVELLKDRGLHVTAVNETDGLSTICGLQSPKSFDHVLSGFHDPASLSVLHSICSTENAVFSWNHPDRGIAAILKNDPYRIGYALRSGLKSLPSSYKKMEYSMPVHRLLPLTSDVTILDNTAIFDPAKTYILFGGIGSLGLRIATWMYENGARHLVLTSRSGRETLTKTKNFAAMRVLRYLTDLTDLDIKLLASDATNVTDLRRVLSAISCPIGGCMMLTAVLEDKMFASLTQDSFERVFAAKIGAFNALTQALDITSLDFLITFTSISGMFGSAGQTNYAAANTALEALTRPYPNAFSLVAPAMLDTAIVFADEQSKTTHNTKVRHISEWGMSSRELCACIEDGIRKLRNGPFWLYVPDFKWAAVRDNLGVSPVFAHLVPEVDEDTSTADAASKDSSVLDIVLKVLDLDKDDFSFEVPLTAYGLDSLLASKLAVTLRPWVSITQLQLLADITFEDIQRRIEAQAGQEVEQPADKDFFDWEEVMRSGPACVKLTDGEGLPLFVLHGPAGTIEAFGHMRLNFKHTPLYGVQATKDAPYDNLDRLAAFYHSNIKSVQPQGPYRLGGFCGSSLLLFILADIFRKNGDIVVQMSMIDHFPLLYTSPIWELDAATAKDRCVSAALKSRGFEWIMNLYRVEKNPNEKRAGEELMKAGLGEKVQPHVKKLYENTMVFIEAHASWLASHLLKEGEEVDGTILRERLIAYLSTFDFPATVYAAKDGMQKIFTDEQQAQWAHMGATMCTNPIRVAEIEASHFDILSNLDFIHRLDTEVTLTASNVMKAM
ncbi:polyketide synthase [Punctularia strigosozonata HHB-11173 SS5]|uniref:polyketide synthase n=1 Tax=Punctularia strigosozonata (strain HHB-11173) TaxID=741275 RepID=UPI0004416E95|nr:polyketide synthase [Punctularia strigosozonata HHB-11173 SS5]EIN09536.1 polyketide synthase [Punctularia strigosozonata HHB-11173 SS5]